MTAKRMVECGKVAVDRNGATLFAGSLLTCLACDDEWMSLFVIEEFPVLVRDG